MTTTRRLGEIAADVHEAIGDQVDDESEVSDVLVRLVAAQIGSFALSEKDAERGVEAFRTSVRAYILELIANPEYRKMMGWK